MAVIETLDSAFRYLELYKGSISDGESNGEGNNTGYKSSSVSNNGGLINFSGVSGERGHGGGESSYCSSVLGVEFRLGNYSWGAEGGLGLRRRGGEGRSACNNGSEDKGDGLEGLHVGVV